MPPVQNRRRAGQQMLQLGPRRRRHGRRVPLAGQLRPRAPPGQQQQGHGGNRHTQQGQNPRRPVAGSRAQPRHGQRLARRHRQARNHPQLGQHHETAQHILAVQLRRHRVDRTTLFLLHLCQRLRANPRILTDQPRQIGRLRHHPPIRQAQQGRDPPRSRQHIRWHPVGQRRGEGDRVDRDPRHPSVPIRHGRHIAQPHLLW